MDFALSPDLKALQERTRRFIADVASILSEAQRGAGERAVGAAKAGGAPAPVCPPWPLPSNRAR